MDGTIESLEEKIVDKNNKLRQKMVKRQLILVGMLNLANLLSFLFTMSFYQWIRVEFQFQIKNFKRKGSTFWINLLYMKEDREGSSYQYFSEAQKRLCTDDIHCSAVIFQFLFVGYLCFSILLVAALLQIYEIITMIYYALNLGHVIKTRKKLFYIISVGAYAVGLSLNAFSVSFIQNIKFQYGLCYWVCLGSLIAFFFITIYGRYSMKKMIKQSLIQNLLDQQKKMRNSLINTKSTLISQQISTPLSL